MRRALLAAAFAVLLACGPVLAQSKGEASAPANALAGFGWFAELAGSCWKGEHPDGKTAAKARELTGRWPTHVVVTHYHADHANGVAGYLSSETPSGKPVLRTTERTRDLVLQKNQPADDGQRVPEIGQHLRCDAAAHRLAADDEPRNPGSVRL